MLKFIKSRGRAPQLGHATRAEVLKFVISQLKLAGWSPDEPSEFTEWNCVLMRRNSVALVVHCSGADFPLLATNIDDIHNVTSHRGCHPLFVFSEQLDGRIYEQLQAGKDILLRFDRLTELDTKLDSLTPELLGCVDHITEGAVIAGWARLSPRGRASVIAYKDRLPIGECVADKFRPDLCHLGDGKFDFEIWINVPLNVSEILDEVRLKAFYNGHFVGLINFWDKVNVVFKKSE